MFATNELWTVLELKLPTGSTAGAMATTNWLGSELELRLGSGPLFAAPRTSLGPSANFHLGVSSKSGSANLRPTLVSVTDDRGRIVSIRASTRRPIQPGYDLALQSNAVSVDVTLALQQSRFVEFIVKPPQAKAAAGGF